MASIFDLDIFDNRSADYVLETSPMFGPKDSASSVVEYIAGKTRTEDALHDDDALSDLMTSLAQAVCPDSSVLVTSDDTSYTDGSTITISKSPLDKTHDLSGIDVMAGLMLHEVSHCLYTDFEYTMTQRTKSSLSKNELKLVHWIHNVIEDEMIERKLGSEWPGYMRMISKVKANYFANSKDVYKDASTRLDKVLATLLYWVRYPASLAPHMSSIVEYEPVFKMIHDVMTDEDCGNINSDITTTQRSWSAAIRIFNIIKMMMPDSDINSDVAKSETMNSDSSMGSTSVSECNEAEGNRVKQAISNERGKDVYKKSKGGSPFASSPKNADNAVSKDIKDVRKISRGKYKTIAARSAELIQMASKMIVKNEVKRFTEMHDNMRNGTIDVRKLASAMCGDDCVWRQSRTKKRNKENARYALVITIDASGSMQYAASKKSVPALFATQMAVAIAEAMRRYPDIDFYAYAHGDYIERLVIKNATDRSGIVSYTSQFDQNELKSYKMIIDEVRSLSRNSNIIAINLTDSLYIVPSIEQMKDMMNSYDNVSWNCIAVDTTMHTDSVLSEREIEYNDSLYGKNNWAHCPCTYKGMIDAFRSMVKIINRNYNKRS